MSARRIRPETDPRYRHKTFEAAFLNDNYKRLKKQAKFRGIEFNLSKEQVDALTQDECFYCGDTGSNIGKLYLVSHREKVFKWNGIDRVDNTKGYVTGNVVTCCRYCNAWKSDWTYSEFINRCKRVVDRHTQ